MTDKIEQLVDKCLAELFSKDISLIRHDVSERAIAHKLAEYLQTCFPDLSVDCEYNRNTERGQYYPKKILALKDRRDKEPLDLKDEDQLQEISTYPDIIIHRRNTNAENLLIIEIKKKNSKVAHDFDFQKLMAFTENSESSFSYHYKHGLFILLETGMEKPQKPELTWFAEGNKL